MTTASIALQKTIYDALQADARLSAMISGVFDWAPDNQPLPYVQIGEDIVTDWSTSSFSGSEHRVTLHACSFATGRLEAKKIVGEICRILQTAPVLNEFQLVTWRFLTSQIFRDADTRLHHGVVEYRARICPL